MQKYTFLLYTIHIAYIVARSKIIRCCYVLINVISILEIKTSDVTHRMIYPAY